MERGVSPQVAIVLLIGFVLVGAILVFTVGMGALDSIQTQATDERERQTLQQFDHDLSGLTNDATGSVYLEEGQYNISNESTIHINSSNGFEELSNYSVPMGTLRQSGESGTEYGYQAGGIWRNDGGGTTVVSEPDLRYYKDGNYGRIDFSIMSLSGNAGPGENSVTQYNSSRPSVDTPSEDEFVSHVEITVEETQYHDGWYEFMSDEFNATDIDTVARSKPTDCNFDADVSFDRNLVCHDRDDQTVTVIATIDGNNPFAHHVGIEPTIYGGLSADSIEDGTVESNLKVSGYTNDTTNTSDDLFTVEDGLELEGDADIEGYPVLNGMIDPSTGSAVDPISYVWDPNFKTNTETVVDDDDDQYKRNETWIAHLTDDVIAANMSRPFETHEGIDDEINNGALGYLRDNAGSDMVTEFDSTRDTINESGRYYTSEFDVDKIDTSDGDVHIGVGDFEDDTLSGLTVTGENQAYIYTDTNDLEITDDGGDKSVSVSGTRKGNFWLYGTSATEITFDDGTAFDGVVYAPDSELTLEEDTTITGAIVAGETTLDDDVTVNFDRKLRTDIPIPEENQDITIEEARDPLDVTFVLDGSGSMGDVAGSVTGDDWHNIRYNSWTVDPEASHSLEAMTCSHRRCTSPETIEPGGTFDANVVRIKDGSDSSSVALGSGNDPFEIRADATQDFISALNESNDDRAGVFEFDTNGRTLHSLSYDLSSVKSSVSVEADGGTEMAAGMSPALDQYSSSNDNERVMVLLSDGKNSYGNSATEEAVDDAIDKDVTIYTVGLGNNLDEELLKETATKTGGEYYTADNAEELKDKFGLIAEREITDKEITFEVGNLPDPGESSNDYVVNIETQQVRVEN
ncbi:hypothetical protein HTG_04435 [Natrinema mahii]|nr:hypothetical protein HTG_04435 [Natrinema mahii]